MTTVGGTRIRDPLSRSTYSRQSWVPVHCVCVRVCVYG